jgi:hypothetical protein
MYAREGLGASRPDAGRKTYGTRERQAKRICTRRVDTWRAFFIKLIWIELGIRQLCKRLGWGGTFVVRKVMST